MKRLFQILALVLIATLLPFASASAVTYEDFTTWTEVDSGANITVTTSTVAWSDESRGAVSYVYKDKGVDYFNSSFQIYFKATCSASTAGGDNIALWSMSNTIGTWYETYYGTSNIIGLQANHSESLRWYLKEQADDVAYTSFTYFSPTIGTDYYIRIVRNEPISTYGDLIAEIYSDSGYNNLLSTLTLHLHKKVDFRYIYAHQSMGYGTNWLCSGLTANMQIIQGYEEDPAVSTLAYPFEMNTDNGSMTIYGQVDFDGGSDVMGWFQYREWGEPTWLVSANQTPLNTNDIWHVNVSGLTSNTSAYYDYRAVGQNSSNITYGAINTILFFHPVTPDMQVSNAYDITSTGFVLDTWFSNEDAVSAWVVWQWREQGGAWQSLYGDGFYYIDYSENGTQEFSGLKSGTVYEYRVRGGNEAGIDYSDTKQVGLYSLQQKPIMDTGNATYIQEGRVSLNAKVVYDGGSYVRVQVEYREVGDAEWQITEPVENLLTDDEANFTVYGIENEITYEYMAVGINGYGTSFGLVRKFKLTESGDGGTAPPDTGVSDFINWMKGILHMSGTFGTWAVMGVLLLIVAMLFGTVIFSVEGNAGRSAIAVAWLLTSVAVVGAFIFSGAIGIWPILILTGGVVVLVIIVVGNKLSGGGV